MASRAKRSSFVPVVDSPPATSVNGEESGDDELNVIGVDTSANGIEPVNDPFDEVEDEDQTVAVSRRIAQGGPLVYDKPQPASWFIRFLFALFCCGQLGCSGQLQDGGGTHRVLRHREKHEQRA